MEKIRDFLEMWYPEYYTHHFTNTDVLETFELVLNTPISDVCDYIKNSKRHSKELTEVLELYTKNKGEK